MNNKLLITILAIVIVAAVGIGYYFIYHRQSEPATTQQSTSQPEAIKKFPKSVFFIHHSTGEIYWNGGMEEILTAHGFDAAAPWWDGETDPPDFYELFSSAANWEILEPYSIIIFKSCFPASNIESDDILEEYKTYYNQLYEIYQNHPDKLFVPMSTPPLLSASTSREAAQRALEFENWLLTEYKENYQGNNLAPFGLHSLLANSNGYLADDFIGDQGDDHPNDYSGEVVGQAIWDHLRPLVE